MAGTIDTLTSATLKHLREAWWDDAFTEFLTETLRPKPGNRILDVGCGEGLAEVAIGQHHISQLRLVGIDLVVSKVVAARQETRSHNQRVSFAAADARHLPFRDAAFDSIYCVAVLQHIEDVETTVREFARVTAPRGRVLAVEPDNSARYGFSSAPAGRRAFELSAQFFVALAGARADVSAAIGPNLPGMFARHGIEPLDVRLFPASQTLLGPPPASVWQARRRAVEEALAVATSDAASWLGREYLDVLGTYEREAKESGPAFVEIQNTMLFATVGQKSA
ncbi:MAG TPA: methyltransferase domain-containing protein [Vicinamibacterales bacterium]|nr:methyltransferase domain-containing protein [Vicinamibacterales bacterium]